MNLPARAPVDPNDEARASGDAPASEVATLTGWHARSVADAVKLLRTDTEAGLASADAATRLGLYGPNELHEAKRRSLVSIVVHQFMSIMVGLLVVAMGVAVALGDIVEACAIVVVILINAAIGAITEWKAAKALEGLRKDTVAVARVLRDRGERQIPASELVLGDVVLISEGDRVPADGRLFDGARLGVDESALTGESVPVSKRTDSVDDVSAALGDRLGMVHMGTAVTGGRGRFVVTATGPTTEMGKVDALVAGAGERKTPLETKLAELGRALVVVVVVVCAMVILVGWLRGYKILYMVEIGISLAVAAVPEGLLAVTTMTLAVGMQRMARMHALVRRLPAVEALGSTTVICTDKTGTLTRNEMTVRAYRLGNRQISVTGVGYGVGGQFEVDGVALDEGALAQEGTPLGLALRIGVLCNDARVDRSAQNAVALGDPTEAALVVAAEKAGVARAELEKRYPRIGEVPFSSAAKMMATVHGAPDGKTYAYVKGAPGPVLDASSSFVADDGTVVAGVEARAGVDAMNDSLASQALRVLALAYRELPTGYEEADISRDLVFVGLVGMIDPLRENARATIASCQGAGLRAIMITGDQEATASEIARQLGLDADGQGRPLRTVHARELEGLDAAGFQRVVKDAAVFARVSPEHKLAIVDALQRNGEVVAMTGDGVNDAPALRKADIGIAMGIRGTEVAKEASAMIITDDDFSTIVGAIEQGRIIVHNILRFIHYLFSSNLGEIVTVFGAVVIGLPLPLAVLQILWLNLVTDIFPAMALALEPSAPDIMTVPPRPPTQPLMTPAFGWLVLWQGALLGGVSLAAFGVGLRWYGDGEEGHRHAGTLAFMTLALAQVFHAFNARSQRRSCLSGLFTNLWIWAATGVCLVLQIATVTVPPLRAVLHTSSFSLRDWGVVVAGVLVTLFVVDVVKAANRALRRRADIATPPVKTPLVASPAR